jgi:hypothetical protein
MGADRAFCAGGNKAMTRDSGLADRESISWRIPSIQDHVEERNRRLIPSPGESLLCPVSGAFSPGFGLPMVPDIPQPTSVRVAGLAS